MPEIIVKYSDERTLEALRDFAKYFDYEILSPASPTSERKQVKFNAVTIIPAESSIDTAELTEVFSDKDIDAAQLRSEAWQRRK